MYKFGERSLKCLETCEEDLVIILTEALKTSMVDFGVSEGHRSLERQQKLYNEGKSRIDGITKKGNHNYFPSRAADIYAYVPGNSGYAFDKVHLAYLGGHIMATAAQLYAKAIVSHKLRWGGNWDGDGTILYDQKLWDMPHFELIK